MLVLYLPCLIFGGALVVMSLFGGADMDADVDLDLDAQLGVDADAGSVDVPAGTALHTIFQFLSFRAIVFFLAFFGLTGTALTLIGTPTWPALLTAGVVGGGSGALVQQAFGYLKRSESGRALDVRELEGARAKVLVGCSRAQRGKISVLAGDRTVQLMAVVAEESGRDAFGAGDTVTILKMDQATAHVGEEYFVA